MSTNKTQKSETSSSSSPALEPSLEKALECARAVIEKKAENTKILDINEISSFTHYFVICSGSSDRQVQAIAHGVEAQLEKLGYELLSSEGFTEGRWVLMDFGDVVVHVFLDALREYYDLENLWVSAPHVKIPAEFYGPGASRLN